MYNQTQLALDDAQRMVAAVLAELEKDQLGAAVAVVDAHGELIAFARTDTCPFPSINIAINKAFSAARQQQETREIGQDARERQFPLTNFGDARFVGWGGGVPVRVNGMVVGAVGVSGIPEEQDIALARMAAALIG